jgi:hypothetical protein
LDSIANFKHPVAQQPKPAQPPSPSFPRDAARSRTAQPRSLLPFSLRATQPTGLSPAQPVQSTNRTPPLHLPRGQLTSGARLSAFPSSSRSRHRPAPRAPPRSAIEERNRLRDPFQLASTACAPAPRNPRPRSCSHRDAHHASRHGRRKPPATAAPEP